jgi:hypothetical protein
MSSDFLEESERDALKIIDKLPVLLKYEKEATGLLAEEGEHCALLSVSGPGLRHIIIHGVVTELSGQKRRWPLVKDREYGDYCTIKDALPGMEGRYSTPLRAFQAIDQWLGQEREGVTEQQAQKSAQDVKQ